MGGGAEERYEKLGLAKSFGRACEYAPACTELSFILRGAYSKLSKPLQSLIFRDTLAAFRLLPENSVQTISGASAAHLLYQASEASLPKHKKAMAISVFKHAVVSQRRRSKIQDDDEGTRHLHQDILVHIFSFLDARSLVVAGMVCRSWNSSSNDSRLWQLQYSLLFGNWDTSFGNKERRVKLNKMDNIDWKKAFKEKYKCYPSWRSSTTRGYCSHCKSIIWASSICLSLHECFRLVNYPLKIRPLSPHEVVRYLLGEASLDASDTDSSDEDSDDSFIKLPRLWAYPTLSD